MNTFYININKSGEILINAFIEVLKEKGYKDYTVVDTVKHLIIDTKRFSYSKNKIKNPILSEKSLTLPGDWTKALEYLEQPKEEPIKAGDFIWRIWPSGKATFGKAVWSDANYKPAFENGEFTHFYALETYKEEGGVNCGEHYGKGDCKYRKATQEEVDAYLSKEAEKKSFKVGDWIYVHTLPTDGHWLDKTNQRVFQLTKEPTQYYGAMMWSTEKPSGNGIKEEYFRKATREEIDTHLLKEAEDKGFKVGAKIRAQYNKKGTFEIEKVSTFFPGDDTQEMSSLIYKHIEKYGYAVGIHFNGDSVIPLEDAKILPNITFGGKPVTLSKQENQVIVECDGVKGTLRELKRIHNAFTEGFFFGRKEVTSVNIKDYEYTCIPRKGNIPTDITIGCTVGEWKELEAILKEGEKLCG